MSKRIIGKYDTGTFYLRYYNKNVPYESDIFLNSCIGNKSGFGLHVDSIGGQMKTERILTFIHELNHYVHDLSLYACMLQDNQQDEIAFLAKELSSKGEELRYPLLDKDNIEYNITLYNGFNLETVYKTLLGKIKLNNYFFSTDHNCDSTTNLKYKNLFSQNTHLCYNDLLEGYVHYKSIFDLLARNKDVFIDNKYLKENMGEDKLNLFPYKMNEDKMVDFSKALDDQFAYHGAKYEYLTKVPWSLYEYFNYLQTKWPENFYNSHFAIVEIGFLMLLDIALSIPSIYYIEGSLKGNKYYLEDFSPVHRYMLALDIIKNNRGFPDAVVGERFYITLFNFIAKKANWPYFEDTVKTWSNDLERRLEFSGDTSVGYRKRLLIIRYSDPQSFMFKPSTLVCQENAIPIQYIVRGGGLKIIRLYSNYSVPYEGYFDIYNLFNQPFHFWGPNQEKNAAEQFRLESDNSMSLMRESIYRSICRNIQSSLLSEDSFTCSFYDETFLGCENLPEESRNRLSPKLHCCAMSKGKCSNIKHLEQLPQKGCAVRDYLRLMNYNINNITW